MLEELRITGLGVIHDAVLPLSGGLTVITGVSGSGKSTLVKKILFPAMQKQLEGVGEKAGRRALIALPRRSTNAAGPLVGASRRR